MTFPSHPAPALAALVAAGALAGAVPLRADVPTAARPAPALVPRDTTAPGAIPYTVDTLPNGLQLILSEDHSTPIAAVDVWYHVGSRNEQQGRYGFAHLFEHMMFQGSAHVGKTELLTRIEGVGGSANGSTTEDRTNYWEVVPADRVNLALWLEADRMRSLALTKENLENQQKTVSEELRQNFTNRPYSLAAITAFYTEAYDSLDCPGYAHSPIGTIHDIQAATLPEVRAFHATYYVPNNATIAVVGDIDPGQVKSLVQRYFGGIPQAKRPPPVTCRVSYDPGFRIDSMVDVQANVPAVFWSYRVPPDSSPDQYALSLVATLFGQGESSRLYRSMVSEAGAALQVNASMDSRAGPGLFSGILVSNQGVSTDSLLALFQAQVDSLHANPPTEAELDKARNNVEADFIEGRERVLSKAEALQTYAFFRRSVSEIDTDLARYEAVTRADLKRVIDRYLNRNNLTVMVDLPQGSQTGAGPGRGSGGAAKAGGKGPGGGAHGGKGGGR